MTESQKQEIAGFFAGKEAYAFKGVVFLFDQIPEKKLQDAIKHYAPLQDGEEAVVFYPYSAKEGFVLTTRALYVNQPNYKDDGCSVRASVLVADISDLGWRKGKGFGNPKQFIDIDAGSQTLRIMYLAGEPLLNALTKTISVINTGGYTPSAGAPQAAPQKSAAGSSPVDTIADVADKAKDVADKAKNALGKLGGLFGKK